MLVIDARRVTGPNHLARVPLVVVQVSLEPHESAQRALEVYLGELARMRLAVGLDAQVQPIMRAHYGGAVFAYPAPIDVMLACTEMSEWAAQSACAILAGGDPLELEPNKAEVLAMLERDVSPRLMLLVQEAKRRDVPLMWDDDNTSLGHGHRSACFSNQALPTVEEVPWDALGSIPIALITGTNGKTTSSRLLARVARESGARVGSTSTDGIMIGSALIEEGDWTGPGAARTVLRHKEVDLAVLETARGGILRRGLGVDRCDVALITNVTADHVGEYGIFDLTAMARVKGVVADVVRVDGTVVLNARDSNLVALAAGIRAHVTYFADLDGGDEVAKDVVARHVAAGGAAVLARGGEITCVRGDEEKALVRVEAVPITFAGAARYNVENVLGVVAAARGLGMEDNVIVRGLRAFEAADNPGRGRLVDCGGVKVLLDFGHNPDGVRVVMQFINSLRGGGDSKVTVITGSAGDRSDQDIQEVARVLFEARADRVWVREIPRYLRGRELGDIPVVFREALLALGMPESAFAIVDSEVDGLRLALSGARPGDVVVIFIQVEHEAMREFLEGWRAD